MRERFRSRGEGEQHLRKAFSEREEVGSRRSGSKEKENEVKLENAQSRTGAMVKRRMASFGRAAECFHGGRWIAHIKNIGGKRRGNEDGNRYVLIIHSEQLILMFPWPYTLYLNSMTS